MGKNIYMYGCLGLGERKGNGKVVWLKGALRDPWLMKTFVCVWGGFLMFHNALGVFYITF